MRVILTQIDAPGQGQAAEMKKMMGLLPAAVEAFLYA